MANIFGLNPDPADFVARNGLGVRHIDPTNVAAGPGVTSYEFEEICLAEKDAEYLNAAYWAGHDAATLRISQPNTVNTNTP